MAQTLIKLNQPITELELDINVNSLSVLWISVKDQLPKQDGKVLAAYKVGSLPPCYAMKVVGFAKDLESVDQFDFHAINESGFYSYDRDWGYVMEHSITHWMPLPGEPEE